MQPSTEDTIYESARWRDHTVSNFVSMLKNNKGWMPAACCKPLNRSAPLAACRFSPLEFALMMKMNLETIEQIYQQNPRALGAQLLHNVCRIGCQPGVVAFLARRVPRAVSEWLEDDEGFPNLPIHLAMQYGPGPDRPTEDDLLELMRIYPASVQEHNWMGKKPWEFALSRKYSPGFVRKIFEVLSHQGIESLTLDQELLCDDTLSPNRCRSAIDLDTAKALAPLLCRVKEFEFSSVWTPEGMLHCMEALLKNQRLTSLRLGTDLMRRQDGFGDHKVVESLVRLASKSRIKKLDLHFRELCGDWTSSRNNGALPWMLEDLVLQLPFLRELTVTLCQDLEPATPGLCQLLKRSKTLRSLVIDNRHLEMETKADLSPILEALACSRLKNFDYFESIALEDNVEEESKKYRRRNKIHLKHLSKALQTNSSLEKVEYRFGYSLWNEEMETFPEYREIKNYAKLNECGRALVRNQSIRVGDFVQLLNPRRLQMMTDDPLELSNVQYGLLLESPSLWAT